MARVHREFVRAARLGAAGRLRHARAAHGARLSAGVASSRRSPIAASDDYGGDVDNRLRFPLEVLRAVRAAWPRGQAACPCASRPATGRPAASAEADLLAIVRAFKEAGVDLIDVSTGQTVPWQKPVYGRMWQTPLRTRSATRSASPPWRWATSTSPTTSTPSSPRAARTCAPSRGRTSPIPPGRCEAAARQRLRRAVVAEAVSFRQESARAQPRARSASSPGAVCMTALAAARRDGMRSSPGASRGIGAAIAAAALAAEGARVSLLARDAAQLECGGAAARRRRAGAQPMPADVSEQPPSSARSQQRAARFGPVHILVNNAGQARSAPSARGTDRPLWHRILAVNLTGTYLCSRAAVPDMLEPASAASSTSRAPRACAAAAYICGVLRLEACRDRPHARAGPRVRDSATSP